MSIRLGLVALIWLCILGGAFLFLRGETPQATAQIPELQRVQADYSLELTTTFPLEKDPFALDVDDEQQAALTISLEGAPLFSTTELPANQPWRVENLPDLVQGANEFLVQATPPMQNTGSYAVRLRLMQGQTSLADKTFWAEQGAPVTGTLQVNLARAETEHDN